MPRRPDPFDLLLDGILAAIAIQLTLRPSPAAIYLIAVLLAFLAGHFCARYLHQRKLCIVLRKVEEGDRHRR